MNKKTDKVYMTPAMKEITIEVEQPILAGSGQIERISRNSEDQGW